MKRFGTFAITAAITVWGLCASPALAADRPDSWVTTKIKLAMLTDSSVSARAINVDTIDGRVVLHGTVSSDAEKQRAEQIAKGIEGAKQVRNLLVVVAPAKQDAVEAKDDDIEKHVKQALDDDAALEDSKISVRSVNGGVVLLGGEATSLTDQLRAMQHASAIPGVKKVASEITGPDTLRDRDIWHGARGAAHDTKSTAKNAAESVKESGKNAAAAARDAGADAADTVKQAGKDAAHKTRTLAGDASGTASDLYITTATKARLMANEETPAMEINVDTRNGVVTLFGIVDSQAAKAAAGAEAAKVSGVRSVQNDLQVVPSAKQELVKRNDDEIRDEVEKRVKNLPDSSVGVEVKNGVVRLTGKVDSSANYLQALVMARSTPGVRSIVADDLEVKTH